MREYETTIIVQPEISDEGSAAIFQRLDEILTDHDSVRLLCENLGKRKLAYEIRKFHKGHYYILSFLGDGQVVPVLERVLRLNESILRFMTIQTNANVVDVEARKVEAAEAEAEQTRKAAERAAREEEEAKARAEIERTAREEEVAKARVKAERVAAEKAEVPVADAEAGGAAANADANAGDSAPADSDEEKDRAATSSEADSSEKERA